CSLAGFGLAVPHEPSFQFPRDRPVADRPEGKNPMEIKIIAEFRNGQPLYEVLPAVHLSGNRYLLTGSPGFATGIASGDEIELTEEERLGYRVLKRGGNVCVQLFLDHCSIPDREAITSI